MADNTLEILIRARDEASKQLADVNRALGQTTGASEKAGSALTRSVDIGLQQTIRSGRAFAVTLIADVNPALAASISDFTAMAGAARLASTAMTAAATIGIAAAVSGLGFLISHLRSAAKETEALDSAFKALDVRPFEEKVDAMDKKLAALRARMGAGGGAIFTPGVEGFAGTVIEAGEVERGLEKEKAGLETTLRLIRERKLALEDAESAVRTNLEADNAIFEARKRHELDRLAQIDRQKDAAVAAAEEEGRGIVEATRKSEEELAKIRHDFMLQEVKEAEERGDKIVQSTLTADETIARAREQHADRTAQALLRIRDQLGPEGLQGAIQATGTALDEEILARMAALDRDPLNRLERFTAAWEKSQRQIERVADSIANVFSDTVFDALEGRIESFGEFFKRTMINVAREASRGVFQNLSRGLLGLGPGSAGGLFSVAAPAAAGVAGAALTPFQAAQGFTQQQALAAQAFFEGGGGGAGPGGTIGNIGTGLGAIGQFLNAPLLTFGTDIGAAALGGAEAAFGGVGAGIGVSALGILAAGLGGVGLGATLFPQGGIGPMIGGGIGGIGGFIGGAALGGALGIASTAALAVILPGVGAILGAVAGSFLGSLFGGSDRAKNVARSQRANQIAQGVAGQIETWARGHAVLGPPLLAVAQYAIGVQTTGRTSSRNQLNVAAGLRSLFSGRVPSDAEVLGFLRSFGPATILTRGLGMSPPSGSLDEIQRLERIALSGTDFLDIGGALFVEEGARLGIPGVEPFITAGLLPQSIESAEVVRLDGIQRLRIKQRQIEAIHQMSPEVAEAFLRKLVKELERLGIPHGNLVEAFQ